LLVLSLERKIIKLYKFLRETVKYIFELKLKELKTKQKTAVSHKKYDLNTEKVNE